MNYISKKQIIIPKRKKSSHKGDNGKLLVVGGSREYTGAVALAGMAALRTGCDYVTVAAPEKVGWAVNALSVDLVVKKFKGDDFCASRAKDVLKLAEGYDAVLIGNGIGMHAKTFCRAFISKYIKTKKPLVIDGDALKFVRIQDIRNAVLTPHKGEFEILLKNSKLTKDGLKKKLGTNVIVLKGKVDEIITSGKTYFNKTGNPGMTKAGTGDVLAGITAGFLAQGLSLFQSAVNGVYINGLIGDNLLKERRGAFSFVASDIVGDVESVLAK